VTFPRLLVAVLIRTVAFAVLFLVVDASYERTDASTDALGLGLLIIAVGLVVTLTWSLVDGLRRGFVAALVLWAVATIVIGLVIGLMTSADLVVDDGTTDVLEGLLGAVLLIGPAALVGTAIGGLLHRVTGWGEGSAHRA